MAEGKEKPSSSHFGFASLIASLALVVSSFALIAFQHRGAAYLLDHLGPLMGIITTIFLGAVVFGSLLSIPITLLIGIAAMWVSIKRGAMHFLYGAIAVAASLADLFIWAEYGGLPLHLRTCHGCVFGVG